MAAYWSADGLLKLARSFQPACVLTAAAEWDVFSALARAPMTGDALAFACGANARAMTVLLDALVAVELLDKRKQVYHVHEELLPWLTEDSPDSILPMLRHQGNCLRRWAQLSCVVRTGEPAERVPGIRGADADQAAFIGAMDNVSRPVADTLIAEIQPPPFKHLLDVGGASGTWTIALLRSMPEATATIFDLPEVIPMARQRIADAGLTDRVSFQAGDFDTDELSGPADMVWLSAIAHQNAREQNRTLFSKIRRSLSPDGRLLLRDIVMNDAHTAPVSGALFVINMLVATPGGGTYTFEEYREDLTAAGFGEVELIRTDPWMNAVIQARPA